jgi:hypothetical protein
VTRASAGFRRAGAVRPDRLLDALREEQPQEQERVGATELGAALRRTGAMATQRAVVIVVSDFRGPLDWKRPLVELAAGTRSSRSRSATRVSRSCRTRASSGSSIPRPGRQVRRHTRSAKLRARFAAAPRRSARRSRARSCRRRAPRRAVDLGRLAALARRLPAQGRHR